MPLDRARFEARVDRSGAPSHLAGREVAGWRRSGPRRRQVAHRGSSRVGDRERSCARRCPGPVVRRRTRLRASGPSTTRSTRQVVGITTFEEAIAARRRDDYRDLARSVEDRRHRRRRSASDSVAARSAPSTALEPTRPKRWPPSSPKSATDTDSVRQHDKQLTVDSLVAWYLEFARRGPRTRSLHTHRLRRRLLPLAQRTDRSQTGQLDHDGRARHGLRPHAPSRTVAQQDEQRPSTAERRVQMGKASPQGDQQPRRRIRVADQHAHATPHHRTRAG